MKWTLLKHDRASQQCILILQNLSSVLNYFLQAQCSYILINVCTVCVLFYFNEIEIK